VDVPVLHSLKFSKLGKFLLRLYVAYFVGQHFRILLKNGCNLENGFFFTEILRVLYSFYKGTEKYATIFSLEFLLNIFYLVHILRHILICKGF